MAIFTIELDGEQFDIEGPDDATNDELMAQAIQAKGGTQTPQAAQPPQPETKPESRGRRIMRGVANALPVVGGIAVPAGAALASGGLSLPATAGLSGAGAAAGAGIKEAILSSLGDQAPTFGEATGRVAKTGITDAILTLAGGKALQGASKVFKAGKNVLFGPGKEAVETALAAEIAPLRTEAVKIAEEIAGLGDTAVMRKQALQKALEKSGSRIGEAEQSLGIALDTLPPSRAAEIVSKEGRDTFMRTVGELAKKSPEELRLIPAAERNILRKMGEEVTDKGGREEAEKLVRNQFDRGLKRIGDSLDLESEELAAGRSVFRVAKEGLKTLPDEMRQLGSQLRQRKSALAGKIAAATEAGTKKVAGAAKDAELSKRLIYASLAGLGLGGASRFLP